MRHPVCLKAEACSSACSDVAVVLLGMSSKRDFRQPKTRQEEEDCLAKSVPQSTRYHTKWAVKIFREWQNSRNIKYASEEEAGFHVELDTIQSLETCITKMNALSLNFWLTKFVQEVCKVDGERYPSRSLYSICCGLQRHLDDINAGDAIKVLSKNESR